MATGDLLDHMVEGAIEGACEGAIEYLCSGFPVGLAFRVVHAVAGSPPQQQLAPRSDDQWNLCGIPGDPADPSRIVCQCSLAKVCAKDRCACDRPRVCVKGECSCDRTKACANLQCSCTRPKVILNASRRFRWSLCAATGNCTCLLEKVCALGDECSCAQPRVCTRVSCDCTRRRACDNHRCHCERPKVYTGAAA